MEKKALKIADSGEFYKLNANLHRLFCRRNVIGCMIDLHADNGGLEKRANYGKL